MHANLVEGRSRRRITGQNSRNQISCLIGNWNVIWERILVSLDSSVRGFDVRGLERRLAYDQRIQDDTERPDVDFVRVACSPLEHFRRNIVWRTAKCSLLFTIKVEFGCEAKVSQLDLHLVI